MVETVGELAYISCQLNEGLQNLNRSIESINDKLRSLDFAIEAWLPDLFLVSPNSGLILGYAKVEDEWQLAVRKDQPEDGIGSATPLIKASRETRVAAVQYVPALLDVLKHEAQKILQAISEAKRLADEL